MTTHLRSDWLQLLCLGLLTLAIAAWVAALGCSSIEHALYTPVPLPPGTTNNVVTLQTRPVAVEVVQATGSLFGPSGVAIAALVVSVLGMGATALNRRALVAHIAVSPSVPPAPPPPASAG